MDKAKVDITIGRPISNTQIYILDEDLKPVPIGVPGELCIAGLGVGAGYLNRPDLTVEKFIPNPYSRKTNHHGQTLYRTGDMARWRENGEIEYLGRMDTQVKIRGQRIELGEIESVMATFEGIELCAVTAQKDLSDRQIIVGYYTAEKKINEKDLRNHLLKKLPQYMVPNFFMHISSMPMTPSGKTDRKNLPVPDIQTSANEYVAPETEMEKMLCHILEELLSIDQIGVTDDFFESGGDSLIAISYVTKAHEKGIELGLQNVFDYTTVRDLCKVTQEKKKDRLIYDAESFEKYNELLQRNANMNCGKEMRKRNMGDILLTGATGFLGAHILEALIKEETGKIYCLVRNGNSDDRRGKLTDALHYYFGNDYDHEIDNRIVLVTGDLEQDGLAKDLPDSIQTVIHAAATVKHFGSYDYFYKVNVEGTKRVAEYSKSVGAELIHISTASVSGNATADTFETVHMPEEMVFDEKCLYIGQPLDNVYIRSKFEAERIVLDSMLGGLKATIIRVGNLTNRSRDLKFQPNYGSNAFLQRMRAIMELGNIPDYLMPLYTEFSPVDETALGVIKLAQYGGDRTVFHLYNSKHLGFERMVQYINKSGISLRVVDAEQFYLAAKHTMREPGREYIFETINNDMDAERHLAYDTNIRIKNDFTIRFLEQIGFIWKDIDFAYVSSYINYFKEVGFLHI